MIKIAIYSLKGGVGKTITTATLAHLYATRRSPLMPGTERKSWNRVLVIDCDSQGNLSQYFKRYGEEQECGLQSGRITGTDWPKLDIITGNMDLYDWERALYERKSTTNIQEILKDIEPGEYDVVFMDCPPAMNMLTINALCAADYLIIPIRLDAFSTHGLTELEQQLQDVKAVNPFLHLLGVLITHDERTQLSEEAEPILRSRFPVFNTKISRSRWVVDSTLMQTPLAELGMNLKPAWQYRKLLKEIIVRIGQHRKDGTT